MHHVTDTQDQALAFLADPASHGGRPVRRIDTHAAAVFLAGERAYKIKRAVKFPFLDYSTLAKRKAACEAELGVNRRFAPQLYRRVLALTRQRDGRLALGGDGEVIEWLLEMRRFDETATLDRLAGTEKFNAALADELGRVVAAGHDAAPVADAAAWIEALGQYIAQNALELDESPDLFAPADVAALTRMSRDHLARVTPLLRRRGQEGMIRRAHGDLHLGNIVLIEGRPVLFDAIEFDPVIASGDVLYDLAFLLMDLIERQLRPLANVVFNRYLTETARDSDLDALAALPLFLSLRAAIRAKVTAARRATAIAEDTARIEDAARAYFRLALHLIAPPAPRLIAIGGLSGTGKSMLARALAPAVAPEPGAVILRSDVMRKRMLGRGETDKLPKEAYTAETSETLYAHLNDKARRAIAAGHSAIVDAVFAREHEREAMAALAQRENVAFAGLFLTADLATRVRRVGVRVGDASDADEAVARMQEHYKLGALTWRQIDASGTPDETLARAKAALESVPAT